MSTLDWSLQQATKTTAQIAAATTIIPLTGQIVWNTDTGKYCIGDGTTALSALNFYGGISASGLTVGTTTITGGTNTKVLYNNNGVVGEYTVTGTGSAVLNTSPTFVTDITTPLIKGGTAAGSIITYKTTTGIGTPALGHTFVGGTNGDLTIATLANNGNITFGNSQSFIVGLVSSSSTYTFVNTATTTIMTAVASTSSQLKTQSGSNSIALQSYSSDANYISAAGQGLYITTVATKNIFFRPAGAGSNAITFSNSFSSFDPISVTTGAITNFTLTTSTNTNQTATTNIPNFKITGSTKQWATGTVANQYFNYFSANTVAFASASTATNVYGLYVEAATAGTNATITNNYSLGTNGKAKFGGNIELTQTVTTEALVSDTSVTIVINGVTYKLLAKA